MRTSVVLAHLSNLNICRWLGYNLLMVEHVSRKRSAKPRLRAKAFFVFLTCQTGGAERYLCSLLQPWNWLGLYSSKYNKLLLVPLALSRQSNYNNSKPTDLTVSTNASSDKTTFFAVLTGLVNNKRGLGSLLPQRTSLQIAITLLPLRSSRQIWFRQKWHRSPDKGRFRFVVAKYVHWHLRDVIPCCHACIDDRQTCPYTSPH